MTYMPKQPKHVKERIEAKLDERVVQKLERYCEYLDSDRDYVISQVLEFAFRKDKGFTQWLVSQPESPGEVPAASEPTAARPGHRRYDKHNPQYYAELKQPNRSATSAPLQAIKPRSV